MLSKLTKWLLAAAVLLVPTLAHGQCTVRSTLLNVGDCINLTTQPAEWPNNWANAIPAPSGTRLNSPVTVGLPIPDLAQIDCPNSTGNWTTPATSLGYGFPPNQGAPTKLQLQTVTGTILPSQMRCVGAWGDSYAMWVLIDYQIPSFTESGGALDSSVYLVKVASGGGNIAPSGGAPALMASYGSGVMTVNTTAATFKFKEVGYNLFDSVTIGATPIISTGTAHSPTDGLFVSGPPFGSTLIASVSCKPDASGATSGPIPTSYMGANLCSQPYTSQADLTAAGQCTVIDAIPSCYLIEENGPLRSVTLEQGDFNDGSGHVYMHWRTRTTCWYKATSCEVDVALRNADANCGAPATQSFCNGGKEYGALEERLTDALPGASRNFNMGTYVSNTPASCSAMSASQSCYLIEGFEQYGTWAHYDNEGNNNCKQESTICLVSPIARSGLPYTQAYALDGYQMVNTAGAGIGVQSDQYNPIGESDFDDTSNGIETGVYQFYMDWPKSLEAQPSTVSGHNQIRIGIKPNQLEWLTTGGSYVINPAYITGNLPAGSTCQTLPCEPVVSYVMPYTAYDITRTLWYFHTGTQTAGNAQNNFLYWQHPLLARATAGCAYYNSATDAATGIPALFYQCPDPIAQDTYYNNNKMFNNLGTLLGVPIGSWVGDVNTNGFPLGGNGPPTRGGEYPGMKNYNFFIWWLAGGNDGTQFEERNSFLMQWLQRGCVPDLVNAKCNGPSTQGSVPGRYIYAQNFFNMVTEKSLPRSDMTITTGSSVAGFRQYCTSFSCAQAQGGTFTEWGDPRGVNNTPTTSLWNEGMENWGDNYDAMDHSTYWGLFLMYHLSGNEWEHEQMLQGFKDRYMNVWVRFNNLDSLVSNAGYGQDVSPRMLAHMLSIVARFADFLRETRDPDMDTSTTVINSPGPTPMAAGLQALTPVFFPLVSGGYPKGWGEAGGPAMGVSSCQAVDNPVPINLCAQGTSPVRGFFRPAHGGETCGSSNNGPFNWKKAQGISAGYTIVDNGTPQYGYIWVAQNNGTTGSTLPAFKANEATLGYVLTGDGSVNWMNQGVMIGSCTGPQNNMRQYNNFMVGSLSEGLLDYYYEMRKIMGRDWHVEIGKNGVSPLAQVTNVVSGGTGYLITGATSVPGDNIVVSEGGLKDALYAAGVHITEAGCENPATDPSKAWVYGHNHGAQSTGCQYNSTLDYMALIQVCGPGGIQACQPASGGYPGVPAGTIIGGAVNGAGGSGRDCSQGGCGNQQFFFAIDAQYAWTNSTSDLWGQNWQFIYSTMEQNQGEYHDVSNHETMYGDYIVLNNGNTNVQCTVALPCSNAAFPISNFTYPLTQIALNSSNFAFGTATGTKNANGVVVTGSGTVIISFPQPAGLCVPASGQCPPLGAPNGVDLVLKYYTCMTAGGYVFTPGENTYGTDCPTNGKPIIPDLGFSTDTTNCNGTHPTTCVILQSSEPNGFTCSGSGTFNTLNANCYNIIGSANYDPGVYQPFFATTNLPNSGNGYSYSGGTSAPVTAAAMCHSGTCSYTMNVVNGQTYTFWAGGYILPGGGTPSLVPVSAAYLSAADQTTSYDSPKSFTLSNPTASTMATLSIVASANFSQTNTCGSSLVSGGTCTINVSFGPASGQVGNLTGTLSATWTGATGSPLSSTLTGTGIEGGQVCLIPPILGAVCNQVYPFQPAILGTLSVDSPAPLILSNTSGNAITTVVCTTTSINAADFSVSGGSCPSTLANNSVTAIQTNFIPSTVDGCGASIPTQECANLQVAYNIGTLGTTRTAASCAYADVQAKVTLSTDGDTVLLPTTNCYSGTTASNSTCTTGGGGSCNWTVSNGVVITKGITLNGQGANINFGTTNINAPLNVTADTVDNAIITTFNITGSFPGGGCAIKFNTSLSPLTQAFRLTGSNLNDGHPSANGTIVCVQGQGPGLIDHNSWIAYEGADELIHNSGCGGPSDFSCWSTDIFPGGPNALYVETNTFSNQSPAGCCLVSVIENYYGAAMVFRYNALNGINFGNQVDVHGVTPGTCSTPVNNGRWFEIYENTWAGPSNATALRGGSGVVWGNKGANSINLLEDCSYPASGSWPLQYQIGRGIGGTTSSPLYAWGNAQVVQVAPASNYIVICATVTGCSHNPADAVTLSATPTTLTKCESAADMSSGCPFTYVYTPYPYPHPLTMSSAVEPLTGTGIATGGVTISPINSSPGFLPTIDSTTSSDSPLSITITNGTGLPITLTGTLTGPNPADFTFNLLACGTIPATSSCSISASFSPLAGDIGSLQATLNITYTGGSSPLTCALTGTGVTANQFFNIPLGPIGVSLK